MWIVRTIRTAIGLVAILSIVGCASQASTGERYHRYMAASNAHDLETIESMTADEIVWHLGPYVLSGKDEALLPHESDAVMNTTLEMRDVRVNGRVVECTVVERNDQLSAVGIDGWRHYARYVFDHAGRVVRKEPWAVSPDDAEVARRIRPFRLWVREHHPDAIPDFEDVTDVFGFAPAQRARRFMHAWIAAGKPGAIDEGVAD
jgi:hypothetical protein